MSQLPRLDLLNLGATTGTPLNLWKLPNGKLSDARNITANARKAASELPQTERQWLVNFVAALRYDRFDKDFAAKTTVTEEDLRMNWKAAVVKQMENKITTYNQQVETLTVKINTERQRLYESVAAYKDNRNGHQLVKADANTWDIIQVGNKNALFDALISMKVDATIIVTAATARKSEILTAPLYDRTRTVNTFKDIALQLAIDIDALLVAYPNQDDIIDNLAIFMNAFVISPTLVSDLSLNFLIVGNAGVGKTTLAGMVAKMLGSLGMYVFKDVLLLSRSSLIAEFEGQTGPKSKRVLASGLERVIFLDEAYLLTQYEPKKEGNPRVLNTYSSEAIGELLTFLEDQKGNMTFIAAGYTDRMFYDFLPANEGIESRITFTVQMDDYKSDELVNIYIKKLTNTYNKALLLQTPVTSESVRSWFSTESLEFMKYVFDQTKIVDKEKLKSLVYPKLNAAFSSQARQMMTMADRTTLLIKLSEHKNQLGPNDLNKQSFVISPEDIYNIIATMIISGKGTVRAKGYVDELDHLSVNGGWKTQTNEWTLPNSQKGVKEIRPENEQLHKRVRS